MSYSLNDAHQNKTQSSGFYITAINERTIHLPVKFSESELLKELADFALIENLDIEKDEKGDITVSKLSKPSEKLATIKTETNGTYITTEGPSFNLYAAMKAIDPILKSPIVIKKLLEPYLERDKPYQLDAIVRDMAKATGCTEKEVLQYSKNMLGNQDLYEYLEIPKMEINQSNLTSKK